MNFLFFFCQFVAGSILVIAVLAFSRLFQLVPVDSNLLQLVGSLFQYVHKTLISVLHKCQCQTSISARETEHKSVSPPICKIFLSFPNFVRFLVLSSLLTREVFIIQNSLYKKSNPGLLEENKTSTETQQIANILWSGLQYDCKDLFFWVTVFSQTIQVTLYWVSQKYLSCTLKKSYKLFVELFQS